MKNDHLTLGDLYAILKKRMLPILLAVLLCGVTGFLLRACLPTRYSAHASFQVRTMQSQAYLEANGLTSSQLALLQSLAKEYAESVPEADLLLDRAIAAHGLSCTREELRAMLSVTTDSITFTVTVTHTDAALATAAAAALSAEIPAFMQEQFWPTVTDRMCVAPLRGATAASRASMAPFVMAGLCALGGALLTYIWFVFRFLFCNKPADGEEIARVLEDTAVLATVPLTLPPADAGEAYFPLRERLPRKEGGALTLSLLSATHGEGASFVSLGLAASLRSVGARVLFIDADLRNGEKKYFSLQGAEPGLAEYLDGRVKNVDKLIHRSEGYTFDILPVGVLPISLADHALSLQMQALLAAFAPKYDYIIADFPALQTAPDGLLTARAFDATLLVAAPRRTGARELRAARAALRNEGGSLLGVVVNYPPRKGIV